MKYRRSYLVFAILSFGWFTASISAADPKPTTHPFVGTTFTSNKVLVVSAEGKVEWEFAAPACMDVWALPNGNFLIASRARGILEVTREKKVVFEYKPAGETYTCQRLPDGRTLVGDNKNARLVEVDAQGKIQAEVKIQTTSGEHTNIRSARRLANKNYLVCQRGDNMVREYDAAGKIVWEFKIAGPMAAVRLPGGNTLMSSVSGDIVEADAKGKTVWKFSQKDLPEKVTGKAYGVQRLPNGNTVICYEGTLHEVTPEGKVVWSRQEKELKGLMCFQLLGAGCAVDQIRTYGE